MLQGVDVEEYSKAYLGLPRFEMRAFAWVLRSRMTRQARLRRRLETVEMYLRSSDAGKKQKMHMYEQ